MGLEKYTVGKLLGKGSFGKALIVTDKTDGSKHVMKEIDISKMPKQEKDSALQEAQLLKALKHPNIVSSRETFVEKGKLCIVMDYCDQGDLYMQLQKRRGVLLDEEQILDWTVQMCLGLKHVHDRKILHRDLKSQNVFVSKGGLLKLGDFGVSKVLNSTTHLATTAVGTPYYLSPEICQNKKYNQKSDIWSLGCLLYEITSLKHAFEAGSLKLLIHKIIRGQYPPLNSRYSQELRSLIDKMITKDPNKRPSINQILAEPIIKNRIKNFLSATLRQDEFSHTIIHGRKKPGELVPGAAAPVTSVHQGPSRLGNNAAAGVKPGLPSQAAQGAPSRPGVAAVGSQPPSRGPSSRSREPQVAQRQPSSRAPAVGQLPPSSAASDQRRLQEAKAAQEKRAKEAKEKEDAAKKAREERQQAMLKEREEHNRRLEEERRRLEDQRKQMEQERRSQHNRAQAQADADRARRAADAEARRQEEAERLRRRAEDLRDRQEQDRRSKADAQRAEKERKELERQCQKESADQARREFIARQKEAARNRNQVEGDVEVRMPGQGRRNAPKPEWKDVTVPDLEEALRREHAPVGMAAGGGGGGQHRSPVRGVSQTELDAAERRRVWEENQAAARRNRAQLEGDQPISVPAGKAPPPQHKRHQDEDPGSDQGRPRRGRWDDRPDISHLPLAERRRVRLEEDAKKREEELRDFQQRNWQEMRAAAERNLRNLHGDEEAASGGPSRNDAVDDADVQEQAAMCAEMARVYNNSVYSEDGFNNGGDDVYEDDDFEDEEDEEDAGDSKEELRKSLSRFMLNGVEIDLGLNDDDSMPARVEALRIYLEDHLGFDSFVKVYQLMEGVSQDDDENEIMEAIFSTLGVEKMPYLQLIHQLIICEESMHQGRV